EEMQSIRAAIVADDLGALTVMETESFRFYLDETTEEPVFLSHTRADGDTFTLPDWSIGTYDGPVYVIVDGSFVGSCVNGTWQSLVDPKDPYEPAKYYRYLIKDIVGRGYNTYAHDREIGFASEVLLYTGVGLGGFEDGDKTELFRPFAKSVSDGVCVLPLPVQLTGSEFDTLEVPTYGYYLKIGTKISENSSTPALAINAQIIPPDGMIWSDSITGDDLAFLEKVLAENGISYENPAITAATGDFDSDDKQETVFFASPQRRSDGYLDISAQNGGLFSVGMLRDDNGTYQKVYTRFLDYTDDVTAHFRVIPLGIFDLNSDGMFEICLKAGEWEGGHTFVLAQNGEGVWETVLRANWGM
ncbi:MAG: hypothetical protein ACOYI2_09575, partial [Bacillota bacterium]